MLNFKNLVPRTKAQILSYDLEDFNPMLFEQIKGIRHGALNTESATAHTQFQLTELRVEKARGNARELRNTIEMGYRVSFQIKVFEAILEHRQKWTTGSHIIIGDKASLETDVKSVCYTNNQLMHGKRVYHNGGCFRFSESNVVDLWLY